MKKLAQYLDNTLFSRAGGCCWLRRRIRRAVEVRSGDSPPAALELASSRTGSRHCGNLLIPLVFCGTAARRGPRRGIFCAVEVDGRSCGQSALPRLAFRLRIGSERLGKASPTGQHSYRAPHRKAAKPNNKGHPKGGLSNLKRSRSQAIPTEVLPLRRVAAKPRPAKPRAIIAQVEGSGAEAIRLLPPNQS